MRGGVLLLPVHGDEPPRAGRLQGAGGTVQEGVEEAEETAPHCEEEAGGGPPDGPHHRWTQCGGEGGADGGVVGGGGGSAGGGG